MSFEKLMRNRESQFEAIRAKLKEQTTKQYDNDDSRLWYPQSSKDGNGSAIIRFLPHPAEENGIPWVQVFQHGFQGPTGSWLIENCPTTLKKKCPICEKNTALWNSGFEKDKQLASKQKRKVHYYSNIYILNDPGNSENNGQVKIFRFGKKIFDMIVAKCFPEFEDVDPINIFDVKEGCDFRLRFKTVDKFRNYDHSTFDNPAPLLKGNKKELDAVSDSMYDLSEFVDPEKFKNYDELKERLNRVNGQAEPPAVPREVEEEQTKMITDSTEELGLPDSSSTEDFDSFFEGLNKD